MIPLDELMKDASADFNHVTTSAHKLYSLRHCGICAIAILRFLGIALALRDAHPKDSDAHAGPRIADSRLRC